MQLLGRALAQTSKDRKTWRSLKQSRTPARQYNITPNNLGPMLVCTICALKWLLDSLSWLDHPFNHITFSCVQLCIAIFFQHARTSIGGNKLVKCLTCLSYCNIGLPLYWKINKFLITFSQYIWPSGAASASCCRRSLIYYNGSVYY